MSRLFARSLCLYFSQLDLLGLLHSRKFLHTYYRHHQNILQLLTIPSLIQLGKVAQKLFPITHSLPLISNAGDIIYTASFLVSLIIWGFAVVWFFVAAAQIIQARHFPFNMGWWGFVFPIGKYRLRRTHSATQISLITTLRYICTLDYHHWQWTRI